MKCFGEDEIVFNAFAWAGIIRIDQCLSQSDLATGLMMLKSMPAGEEYPALWLARQLAPIYDGGDILKKPAKKAPAASPIFLGETLAAEIGLLRERITALEEGGEWRERALKAERDLAHGTLRFVDENGKVQKELAEAKSKLDKAEAEANQRGLQWMEKANHWENRALIAEKKLAEFQKYAGRSRENDPSPEPDCCVCLGYSIPNNDPLDANRSRIGRWRGWDVTSEIGCQHCGGSGYRRKSEKDRCTWWREFENSGNSGKKKVLCNLTIGHDGPHQFVQDEELTQKSLRLLVEVVPQKDEKHGTGGWISGMGMEIRSSSGKAFSVEELPPMPPMDALMNIYIGRLSWKADLSHYLAEEAREKITKLLKACGLEVPE